MILESKPLHKKKKRLAKKEKESSKDDSMEVRQFQVIFLLLQSRNLPLHIPVDFLLVKETNIITSAYSGGSSGEVQANQQDKQGPTRDFYVRVNPILPLICHLATQLLVSLPSCSTTCLLLSPDHLTACSIQWGLVAHLLDFASIILLDMKGLSWIFF